MNEFHVTLVIQTEKSMTDEQLDAMREAIVSLIDDEMLLRTHSDADLVTSTVMQTFASRGPRPIVNGKPVRYVVDGHEFPDTDSNLMGDGKYPPFRVFDVDAQDYVGRIYDTRAEAETEAERLNKADPSL